jgi:hypothetical protein
MSVLTWLFNQKVTKFRYVQQEDAEFLPQIIIIVTSHHRRLSDAAETGHSVDDRG